MNTAKAEITRCNTMKFGKDIIVCKIFEHELKAVTPANKNTRYHWIDAALHANPVEMKTQISNTLSKIESPESEIGFLFGNGCHPDMCAIAKKHGVVLPAEKNCIHAFLGVQKTKELEDNRTMIITPGWLDAWHDIMAGLGWDEVDVRINMGRYDRMLLLDPAVCQVDAQDRSRESVRHGETPFCCAGQAPYTSSYSLSMSASVHGRGLVW